MAVQTGYVTVQEFDRFIALPENDERRFEYFAGEIVEMVTNYRSSLIAARILVRISTYVENNALGYVSGADGGYVVSGHRYLPDVAFVSKARQPASLDTAYNPDPPDLAVEVLSPTDKPGRVRTKIASYLAAGTIVWIVDPDVKEVEVYAPGQAPKTLRIDEVVDGGSVLPGFSLTVKDVFQV